MPFCTFFGRSFESFIDDDVTFFKACVTTTFGRKLDMVCSVQP